MSHPSDDIDAWAAAAVRAMLQRVRKLIWLEYQRRAADLGP